MIQLQMIAKTWSISPKVSCTHLLKYETKGLKLCFQSFCIRLLFKPQNYSVFLW